jgi:hypothetical protein
LSEPKFGAVVAHAKKVAVLGPQVFCCCDTFDPLCRLLAPVVRVTNPLKILALPLRRKALFKIVDEPSIHLFSRLGYVDECLGVMSVDADREVGQLAEIEQALDVPRPRNGEIGVEAVTLDGGRALQMLELAEDAAIHENVTGARREIETPIAHVDSLADAAPEELVFHRDFWAAFF